MGWGKMEHGGGSENGRGRGNKDEERSKVPARMPMRVNKVLSMLESTGKSSERILFQSCQMNLDSSESSAIGQPIVISESLMDRIESEKKATGITAEKSMIDRIETEKTATGIAADSHGKLGPFHIGDATKSDRTASTKNQRMQPVKVKHLLESLEKSKTAKITGRATLCLGRAATETRNIATPMHPTDSHGKLLPVRVPVRITGLSKSDGKAVAKNERSQLVNAKRLMESWEKNQTAKVEGPKFRDNRTRTTTVRRKLYSNIASPIPPQKPARKSFLLPPNSISNRYIAKKATKSTIDGATNENTAKIKKNIPKKTENVEENTVGVENCTKNLKTVVEEEPSSRISSIPQMLRPSVIMGSVTSTDGKKTSVSSQSSVDSEFTLSRPPLQEFNKISTMSKIRIDDTDTSLTDLLQNSRISTQNPPPNLSPEKMSLLENSANNGIITSQMDRQTMTWLRENLKLSIQTTEESLFSMRRMLATINNIMESNSRADDDAQKISTQNSDAQIERRDDENDEVFRTNADEADKENCPAMNDQLKIIEGTKNQEKTRRRSARLAAARSPKSSDNSFLQNEAELNIAHEKIQPTTPRPTTATKKIPLDPRCRRSLREYMALKSRVSFLQTPDPKGLPTPKSDKTGTPLQRRAIERALSRRVLEQLNDLYDDSPE